MKNNLIRSILVCVIIGSLVVGCITLLKNVKAADDGFVFNGSSFDFYDSGWGIIYLKMIVDCDFPEGIPHKYEPYPDWNPGYYESYEMINLEGPTFLSTGNIDTKEFLVSYSDVPSGDYQFKVIENNTKVLFTHNFTLSHSYSVTVKSVNWRIKKDTSALSSVTFKNSTDENLIDRIKGVELSIVLENTGDIPISIGAPDSLDLNIEYQMNLYKEQNSEAIYSSEIKKMARSNDLFDGQNYDEKHYLKPQEKIEYTESLTDDFIDLSEYGAGTYSIDGYVKFGNSASGNFTIDFSAPNVLTITGGGGSTPGFEFIIAICTIALVLIWKRK